MIGNRYSDTWNFNQPIFTSSFIEFCYILTKILYPLSSFIKQLSNLAIFQWCFPSIISLYFPHSIFTYFLLLFSCSPVNPQIPSFKFHISLTVVTSCRSLSYLIRKKRGKRSASPVFPFPSPAVCPGLSVIYVPRTSITTTGSMKISGSILLFIKTFFGISDTIYSESKLSIFFASSSVKPVPTVVKVSKRCFSSLRAAQRRAPNELFLLPLP